MPLVVIVDVSVDLVMLTHPIEQLDELHRATHHLELASDISMPEDLSVSIWRVGAWRLVTFLLKNAI